MLRQHEAKHGAIRVGGARDSKGVRGYDSRLNCVLPFLQLFLLSVSHVHRDSDIKTEIHRKILRTGGVGADTDINGSGEGDRRRSGCGGNGGGDGSDNRRRFEETVRAYCGLLTVKTLHGFLVTRLELRIWWNRRCV
jgi:hypothetical protein